MVDAGDLAIVVRDGRLQLPNDVLFDTAKTEIKPAGRAALQTVAALQPHIDELVAVPAAQQSLTDYQAA